jgi:hypothetical protein
MPENNPHHRRESMGWPRQARKRGALWLAQRRYALLQIICLGRADACRRATAMAGIIERVQLAGALKLLPIGAGTWCRE